MLNEQSYIEKFTDEMLYKYGLNLNDKEFVKYLVDRAINEKLYTSTNDYQHNLMHIEKVITYTLMIINKMNNSLINKKLLLYAALYHDIGKTIGASNQEHGLVGVTEFRKMMKYKLDSKELEIISLLIFQHAEESDIINFSNDDFSKEEQKSIQLMSNILKDADALDRNRFNTIAPFGCCDANKLRTSEAKEVFKLTDSFYQDYYRTIIEEKEKECGKKILNNYELLNHWIKEYHDGKENLFHASLNPCVDILRPNESTQKGSYVYAGINPINCMAMASFRSSLIFPRAKINGIDSIIEIFPNLIHQTLDSKYITFYKLPNDKFHEYIADATAAPTREWISKESVEPVEQISFKVNDLLNYLNLTNQFKVAHDYSKERQFESYVQAFRIYIWGIKHLKDNPKFMNEKWKSAQKMIEYYSHDNKILKIMNNIKKDVDNEIYLYISNFKLQNGREPHYDNEKECLVPILQLFEKKYYIKDKDGKKKLNYDYIYSLNVNDKGESFYEELEMSKKGKTK